MVCLVTFRVFQRVTECAGFLHVAYCAGGGIYLAECSHSCVVNCAVLEAYTCFVWMALEWEEGAYVLTCGPLYTKDLLLTLSPK